MRARTRPAMLVALLVAVLIGAATAAGYGPLAGNDPEPAPVAAAPTTAPLISPTPAATTPDDAAATSPADDASANSANSADAADATTAADPLNGAVPPASRRAFERSVSRLLGLEHGTEASVAPIAAAATGACAHLGDEPLSAAIHATCADTIAIAKLSRVLQKRCLQPGDACSRTAMRLADATTGYVDSKRALARTVRRELPAGDCRTALLPTHDDLAGLGDVAKALRHMARAALAQDPAGMADAGQELSAAGAKASTDTRPAVAVIEGFRAACRAGNYPDYS